MSKTVLTLEEIESQTALELPARELLQVIVVITNLITLRDITVTVRDVNVAAQVCAQLVATGNFECTFTFED
jgi:hypothetical protein